MNTPKVGDDDIAFKPDSSTSSNERQHHQHQQRQEQEEIQSFFNDDYYDDDDDDFDARTNKVGEIIEIEIPREYDVEMTDIWFEDDDCIECVLGAIYIND